VAPVLLHILISHVRHVVTDCRKLKKLRLRCVLQYRNFQSVVKIGCHVFQKFKQGTYTDSRAPQGHFPFLTKDGRLKITEAPSEFFSFQKFTLNSMYIEAGYNDIGLCCTSFITLDILWHELIPRC